MTQSADRRKHATTCRAGLAASLILVVLSFSSVRVMAQETPQPEVQIPDTSAVLAPDTAAVPVEQAPGEPMHELEYEQAPPLWLTLPFVILLLMIATGPLLYEDHWHHHYAKYAVMLGVLVAVYYYYVMHTAVPIVHGITEYLSFIALLASLFIASGGIFIHVNAKGTPLANAAMLFFGALISNVIGTTGASMLLIQPFMRLNKGRIKAYHIIFFIFLISNIGGGLTPVGDPPLFLGFLRGVSFFWTLEHVWYVWLPTVLLVLAIFYVFDKRNTEASTRDVAKGEPVIRIGGHKNFFWLAAVVLAVFIDPNVFSWVPVLHVGDFHAPFGIRELVMFAICFFAYRYASAEALEANDFNFAPIKEVAWLFIGIFLTMQPALELIRDFANANHESLTVSMFYWGTGSLSGVLDNAPTYVSFLSAAMGKFGLDVNMVSQVHHFSLPGVGAPDFLQAISIAAVFFGAMTYIGNGPNFMVKAIAEASGVDCPSFAGYLFRYSLPILIPTYFLVWAVLYSGWIL